MRTTKQLELAWAAGFFDGEGHVAHKRGQRKDQSHRKTYHNIIMDIRQVDRRALDRFQKAIRVNGKVYGPWRNKNPRSKPFYGFALCCAPEVIRVVKLLWPYLGPVKREQAEKAIVGWLTEKRLKPGRKKGKLQT